MPPTPAFEALGMTRTSSTTPSGVSVTMLWPSRRIACLAEAELDQVCEGGACLAEAELDQVCEGGLTKGLRIVETGAGTTVTN
jgi:hypothetical protein